MQRYRRVTFETRCHIRAFLNTQFSINEIARRLNCHRSTIYRELRRNSVDGKYDADAATKLASTRFLKCRRQRLLLNEKLAKEVEDGLQSDWSPEQIAGRLKRVSHQTIYNEARRCKTQWRLKFRKFPKKTGRGRWGRRRSRPFWVRSIRSRPPEVNQRKVFGHWERDTLYTKDRKLVIMCIERMSRYVKIAKVEEPYTLNLTEQTRDLLRKTGAPVHSLTNDHGNEFMDGYLFRIPVYYCDPHSPHQKGSVENAIGLLRQYIPKKADLTQLTDEKIKEFEDRLNNRPRKCLDYKTPAEVFKEQTVALAI